MNSTLSDTPAAILTPIVLPPGSTPPTDAEICRRIGIEPLGVNRQRQCVFKDVRPGQYGHILRAGQQRIPGRVYEVLHRHFGEFISRGGRRPGTYSREQVRQAISNECWRLCRQHGFIDGGATA